MKAINVANMRALDGGYTTYKCTRCNSFLGESSSKTVVFWHVHAAHKIPLLKVWSYIRTTYHKI